MATYSISAPDGNTYEITGPAGATQEQVQAEVLKQHPTAATPKAPAAQPAQEPSFLTKALNTLGSLQKGVPDAAMTLASHAVGDPLADAAGLGAIPLHALGLIKTDPAQVKQNVQNMNYQPQTQMGRDIVGAAGNAVDNTLGAASRYLGGKAGEGATALGASQPVSEAVNNGVSALGQNAPALLGTKLPALGDARVASAAQDAVAAAPRQAALQSVKDSGYLIPPSEMISAPVGKTLTGVAGKDQINRGFSIANQKVTNQLAAQDLGVPPTAPFDQAAVAKVKANANAVYDTVKQADQAQIPALSTNGLQLKGPTGAPLTKAAGPIIPDKQFEADVNNIGADRANATFGTGNDKAIADLKANLSAPTAIPSSDLVDKIKTLRQDARTNLNATDDVEKQALGRAQQQAAAALEAQFDRYLQPNQPGLLKAYQTARTTLAKAHTVEDAMSADGNIDAAAINKYRNNGGYVDGGLKQIADAADTIGNVVKNTSKVNAPEPFSKMQFLASLGGLSAGGGQVAGHAGALGGAAAGTLMAGPSLARGILGSGKYQATLGGQVPQAGTLSQLAANPASPLAALAIPRNQQNQ